MVADLSKPRRIELILRQIDSLPTLPIVATRLLSLTSRDETHARQVIDLVSSDPAMTAKILAMCRAADKGIRDEVLTIDKAVVLLGFNAIRNCVLSVKVFEIFGTQPEASSGRPADDPLQQRSRLQEPNEEHRLQADPFNRDAFWTHSLAVATCAERIAAAHPDHHDLPADEAFVCGLLHDVGKIALDHVLPKAFARVVELAELNQTNITEFERRIIGIDHHTAGKRLAEMWRLPHRLQDCIWLHGSTFDTMPKLDHRRLVGLITLADFIARKQHLGFSGNYSFKHDATTLCQALDLDPEKVEKVSTELFDAVRQRSEALGLGQSPSNELFIDSIQRANAALGRLNNVLDRRSQAAGIQAQMLEAITNFHSGAGPARSVQDVLDDVAVSAKHVFGHGFFTLLYPVPHHEHEAPIWLISQYDSEGQPIQSQYTDAPPMAPDLTRLDLSQPMSMDLMTILPWVADYLVEAPDMRQVRMLPLASGWGTAAVLLHDRANLPPINQLAALTSTWGGAIAGAAQHDGARRLGEQLAESNSALAEAQDKLLRQESLARLGQMAAGAAHEMNNPLAVISGRSQLLSMSLQPGSKEQQAAQLIFTESHRLSDLITSLHMFADPPRPALVATDLEALLDETVRQIKATQLRKGDRFDLYLRVKRSLPTINVDGEQIQNAVIELLLNAMQSNPKRCVELVAQLEPGDKSVVFQVIDDGDGMDDHVLSHALDPFFSAKPAGRRVGMGLPRAQQIITAHNGTLDLRSTTGHGTVVTVTLPLDSTG